MSHVENIKKKFKTYFGPCDFHVIFRLFWDEQFKHIIRFAMPAQETFE